MEYRQLDFAHYETRLLRILNVPFYEDYPVQCTLIYTSLDEAPDYHALSYCWGDPTKTLDIIIDGRRVPVTTNLEAALCELRRRGFCMLWVDAVCINQNDLYEKNHQVLRMGQIYSRAYSVIAWLGPASSTSDYAMRVISRAYDEKRRDVPTSVLKLLQRPFWERVWIVQEISRATKVQVLCGCSVASWDDIVYTLDRPRIFKQLPPAVQELLSALYQFRSREQQSHIGVARMLLSEALVLSRRSLATNPRDKIYALLALTLDGAEVVPMPSYSQTVEHVFINATRTIAAKEGQTAITLLTARSNSIGRKMPSWVPDWSNLGSIPPWVLDCVNQGRQSLSIHSSSVDLTIEVRGVVLETIVGLGATLDHSGVVDQRSSMDQKACNKLALSRHLRDTSVVLDRLWNALTYGDGCVAGASISSRFISLSRQTFFPMAALCLEKGKTAPSRTLRAWMNANGRLQLGSRTIREWLERYYNREVLRPTTNLFATASSVNNNKITKGLAKASEFQMRLAISDRGGLRNVYDGARIGDKICRLENCTLPVVLRPLDNECYSLVGECFLKVRPHDDINKSYWTQQTGWSADEIKLSKYDVLKIV